MATPAPPVPPAPLPERPVPPGAWVCRCGHIHTKGRCNTSAKDGCGDQAWKPGATEEERAAGAAKMAAVRKADGIKAVM